MTSISANTDGPPYHRYDDKGLKQQKVTFKLTQSLAIVPFDKALYNFLLVFHCNYVSIFHHFRDIVAYFPKFQTSRDRNAHLRDNLSLYGQPVYKI